MIEHTGDMWSAYPQADLFLFTGNGSVTKAGKLVMGRGMALEIRDRFPGLDKAIGNVLRLQPDLWSVEHQTFVYHLEVGKKIGVFQVKYHWYDDADLKLIEESALALALWAADHPDKAIHLNYPGIGNGHLSKDAVRRTVAGIWSNFPNIHVWERA